MIFLDFPRLVRPGEAVVPVQGWYAGEAPCHSVTLRIGTVSIPLLQHARPDVCTSYPTSQTAGFRGILDFVSLPFEDHYSHTGGKSALLAEIVVNDTLVFRVEIPVDEDWFSEITRAKANGRRGFFPNGLPNPNPNLESLGLGLAPGDSHYRAYVGLSEHYDLSAAGAFFLLVSLGLRQHHVLLDIGCGSLRCGRLLIPYLNAGNYLGIEPNAWLVEQGLRAELGHGIGESKAPRFIFSADPGSLEGIGPVNFALANSIFSHASQPQIVGWLKGASNVLSVGGALVATFVTGSGDYQGSEWVYPACVSYRSSTMRMLAESAGYTLTILDWRHLHAQTWAVFAKSKFDVHPLAEAASWNALAKTLVSV